MYRDYIDGFVPDIVITQRPDNGHFIATACGLSATHHDQAEAVNRLTDKLQDGLVAGQIHP